MNPLDAHSRTLIHFLFDNCADFVALSSLDSPIRIYSHTFRLLKADIKSKTTIVSSSISPISGKRMNGRVDIDIYCDKAILKLPIWNNSHDIHFRVFYWTFVKLLHLNDWYLNECMASWQTRRIEMKVLTREKDIYDEKLKKKFVKIKNRSSTQFVIYITVKLLKLNITIAIVLF